MGEFSGVKALTFDVFGTVVDWRRSSIRKGEVWGREKGLEVDWAECGDAYGFCTERNGVRAEAGEGSGSAGMGGCAGGEFFGVG